MNKNLAHHWAVSSRREFFQRAGSGLASIALAGMLNQDGLYASPTLVDPLAPKKPHHEPKAKSVIWLFMEGGPSHVDIFDPKPKLTEMNGQPMPASFGKPITAMGTSNNTLLGSKRTFKQYGQSGMWVSDWYPNVAQHVDEMSIIRSCWADDGHLVDVLRYVGVPVRHPRAALSVLLES